MRKYIIILIGVALTSCCGLHTEITYKYKDTTIKSVNVCGKTTFYYNNADKSSVKIFVEYSGINDGFSGYLKFIENGKVLLLSGNGYFQTVNSDTSKFEYRRITAYQRPILDESTYYITTAKREQKKNKNIKTDVKVEYNIDENEWW